MKREKEAEANEQPQIDYKYENDKAGLIQLITDHYFLSLEEALSVYRPCKGNEELRIRLLDDKDVQYEMDALLTMRKVELRATLNKSAVKGDIKAAKAALSLMADEKEWTKLNGRAFNQLGLGMSGGVDRIVVLPPQMTTKQAKKLLADSNAVTAKVVKEDKADKIEFAPPIADDDEEQDD